MKQKQKIIADLQKQLPKPSAKLTNTSNNIPPIFEHLLPFLKTTTDFPYTLSSYKYTILVTDHLIQYSDGRILIQIAADTTNIDHGWYFPIEHTKKSFQYLYYNETALPISEYPNTEEVVIAAELEPSSHPTIETGSQLTYFLHSVYNLTPPLNVDYLSKIFTYLTKNNIEIINLTVPESDTKPIIFKVDTRKTKTTILLMPMEKI